MGGVAELLSGSWGASGGVFGGLGEVFGVMLAPKMAAKSGNYRKNILSQEAEGSTAVLKWILCGR